MATRHNILDAHMLLNVLLVLSAVFATLPCAGASTARAGAVVNAGRTKAPKYPSFGLGLHRRTRNTPSAQLNTQAGVPVDDGSIVVIDDNLEEEQAVFHIDDAVVDSADELLEESEEKVELDNEDVDVQVRKSTIKATIQTVLADKESEEVLPTEVDVIEDGLEDVIETEEHYIEIVDEPLDNAANVSHATESVKRTLAHVANEVKEAHASGTISIGHGDHVIHSAHCNHYPGHNGESGTTTHQSTVPCAGSVNADTNAQVFGGTIGANGEYATHYEGGAVAYTGSYSTGPVYAVSAGEVHGAGAIEIVEDGTIAAPVIVEETPTETIVSLPTSTETSTTSSSSTPSSAPKVSARSNGAISLSPSMYVGAAVLVATMLFVV